MKFQFLKLSLFLVLFLSFSVNAKTLKVDTITPSVTNGDLTLTENGTGDIIFGSLSGRPKLTTGVLSVSALDVASEITGIVPVANGGTGSSSQNFVDLTTTQTVGGEKTFDEALTLLELASTPSTPAAGDKKIYCLTDDSCYQLNDAGTETALGAGGGGSGDVIGPATSADQSIVRFNGTDNKTVEDSKVSIDDDGRIGVDSTSMGESTYLGSGAGAIDDLSLNKNVGIGFESLNLVVGGSNNTAAGYESQRKTSSGGNNTSLGYQTLWQNQTGSSNTAIGTLAQSASTGADNTSVGYASNSALTSGIGNAALGRQAGRTGTGDYNVNIGFKAGYGTSGGDSNRNVFIGSNTGAIKTAGDDNIIIGAGVNLPTATTSDYLSIGDIITGNIGTGVVSMDSINIASTSLSSTPCPLMTTSNMDAVSSPSNGSCVFNTDEQAQYNYNNTSSQWVIAGAVVNTENITDWVEYAPTYQGLGTVTNTDVRWRRVGDSLHLNMAVTLGTTTASEIQIGLPTGLAVSSSYNGVVTVGRGDRDVANESHYSALATAADTYLNIGFRDGASSPNIDAPQTGTALLNTADKFYVTADVKIEGWESTTKYAASSCDGLACFNTFSAKVAATTGVVSDENLDWIDGNCVITGTSIATCTYVSSLVTVAMNCNSSAVSSGVFSSVRSSTTSLMSANAVSDGGAATASDLIITCHRAGADFFDHDERFIEVNDQENVYSARIANNGTATVVSESDGFISTVTRTALGDVDIVFNTDLFSVSPSVVATAVKIGSANGSALITAISATGVTVQTEVSSTAGAADYDFHIVVQKQGADYSEPKAYVGNLNPKTLVETPGSNLPKMYSATVSAAGVVSSEVSNWISGSCTNAHPSVCTLESDKFINTPVCTTGSGTNSNMCATTAASNASITLSCVSDAGVAKTTTSIKHIICHGE